MTVSLCNCYFVSIVIGVLVYHISQYNSSGPAWYTQHDTHSMIHTAWYTQRGWSSPQSSGWCFYWMTGGDISKPWANNFHLCPVWPGATVVMFLWSLWWLAPTLVNFIITLCLFCQDMKNQDGICAWIV